jgi:Clostripain family
MLHDGFWYVSQDEDTGDKLYMRETLEVLARYKDRLDMIGFDAGLSAMSENAYALRDCGSIMLGSEDVEPVDG